MISITASTDQATRKDPNFEMSTDPNWSSEGMSRQITLQKGVSYEYCTTSKDDSRKKTLNMTFPCALQLEVKWKT